MDNKLDTTPFPADIAEMVLNKESRHPSLQGGPVFVDVTFTDNYGGDLRYRMCYVGPQDINGKHYANLAVSISADDLLEVAAKLRDGYFTEAMLCEAARDRDERDAAEAAINAANKARKGAANE